MQINSVSGISNLNFLGAYATTSTKNHGDYIDSEVIKPFNKEFLPSVKNKTEFDDFKDIKDNVNAFSLQAGSGSRFKALGRTQGEKVNKISFALPLLDGSNFHIPDVSMAMIAPFSDENGIQRINAAAPEGSFADVLASARQLKEEGKPQKDVIVCCGDNFFHTEKPFELNYFIKDVIEDPNAMLGLIGVAMKPEELVNKFAALKVYPTEDKDILKVGGMQEKPETTEIAEQYAMKDGRCVASVGMFTIKAQAMEWLLDKIDEREKDIENGSADEGFITRGKDEPYDFSTACTRIVEEFGPEKCKVKLTDTWEDAGDPAAFYESIEHIQKGKFLTNFDEYTQDLIKESLDTIYDPKGKTLLASQNALAAYGCAHDFSDNPVIKNGISVTNVEGVNVVV